MLPVLIPSPFYSSEALLVAIWRALKAAYLWSISLTRHVTTLGMEHCSGETLTLPGRPAGAVAQALQRRAPWGRVLRRGKAGPRLRLAHQQGFSASIMEITCGVSNQEYSEVQDVNLNCETGRRGQHAGARLARALPGTPAQMQ